MTCRSAAVATGACLLAGTVLVGQQKELSQDLKLRIQVQQLTEQVYSLKLQLAQCRASAADIQARYDSIQLSSQGSELKVKHEAMEAEIKKALGGTDSDTIDWTTDPPSLKKTAPIIIK